MKFWKKHLLCRKCIVFWEFVAVKSKQNLTSVQSFNWFVLTKDKNSYSLCFKTQNLHIT